MFYYCTVHVILQHFFAVQNYGWKILEKLVSHYACAITDVAAVCNKSLVGGLKNFPGNE